MQTLLGIIHGADYALNFFLAGFLIFIFLILPASQKNSIYEFKNFQKKIKFLIGLSIVISSLWVIFSAQDMAESWDFSEIWNALSTTSLGHLGCAKIVLLLILLASFKSAFSSHYGRFVTVGIILGLPLFYVFAGHATSQVDQKSLRIILDYIHLLSVGIWTGGLWALFLWLGQALSIATVSDAAYRVTKRFSHFAMTSTALILLTGLAMTWLSGVSLLHPFSDLYSQLVFAKLGLFFLILSVASVNQFIHLKKRRADNELQFIRAIRREVRIEIVLVMGIFIVAGFLARTDLPAKPF